jgi:uncharacterized protein
MAEYLTPGVYRQDVYPPVPPLFLTGVPAFLGRAAATMPDGVELLTAYRVSRWPQFALRLLAAADADGYLADAVRGFLANGGTVCYAVLLGHDADPADAVPDGLAALEGLDDVDLLCVPDLVRVPDWTPEAALDGVARVQRALLDHCAARGDRFAILDGVPSPDAAVLTAQRGWLTGPAAMHGALYHPWLQVAGLDGAPRFVPPSGHVAGIYARSDQAVGVHKAPANEHVEAVFDLQTDLDDAEIGRLNDGGVNCIRARPGRGVRVWGARTVSEDPAWRDVNVRRVVSTIGRWIERFMTGLVHEPNDVRLWVRIMRELTAYLEGMYQRGALKGSTADEAFFVKCDDETNPRELQAAGVVVTQIGVAPTVPAEFIVVRVIQGANGVTVNAA